MSQMPHREADTLPHRQELHQRLRAAFVEGAEEHSRREYGRGLTSDGLRRVLRRYPGDPANR